MTTPENTPPVFPQRALASKAVLYRPLQDIDIYVEDEGSEVFYTELLKRLVGRDARIAAVVPLRGRDNVIKKAQEYSASRPALFLIDGDLHWLAGLSLPTHPHIYVHPCYCVENYLFCENAMIQIVVENQGSLKESDAKLALDWKTVRDRIEKHLVPLFIEFAVAFALCPEVKTVSRGIGCLLRNSRKGSPPEMDEEKIAAVRQEVKDEVIRRAGTVAYELKRSLIAEQVKVLADPIDAVSGKDFLVPVQMFEAGRVGGQKVQRKSFVFRLARHCRLDKLDTLRQKVLEMLGPNKAMEATA